MAPSSPNRMDIALFVGFVRRNDPLIVPAALDEWLEQRGWKRGPYARPADVAALLDVPVPIQNLAQFEALFDWQHRTADPRDGASYLGAAVRSYFAQGGRFCYVVRAGEPMALEAARAARLEAVARLIPGYPAAFRPSPVDRASWHGVGHLFGLPDVSFVVMPDLAEAVANDRVRIDLPAPLPDPPEAFVECTPAPPAARRGSHRSRRHRAGLRRERLRRLEHCARTRDRRALAIRARGRTGRRGADRRRRPAVRAGAADRVPATRVSLARRRRDRQRLPGQVESPDGVLAGILARNALFARHVSQRGESAPRPTCTTSIPRARPPRTAGQDRLSRAACRCSVRRRRACACFRMSR